MRGTKPRRSSRPKSYKVLCAGCGKEVVVLSPPPEDKKLLCMECFKKWSPTGKPVVPLQTPLRGEHLAQEDQFTHG